MDQNLLLRPHYKMKFIRQIFLLLIFPLCSNAQNGVYFIPTDKQTDSVRTVLKHTTNDTLKMSSRRKVFSHVA